MEIMQIVLQIKTADEVRSLRQCTNEGDDLIVLYNELSEAEKAIWDSFVQMISSK